MPKYPLLESVASPADIRRFSHKQLNQLAQELRSFLIESVANTGGHFAASLGTVELTIALHYVFNTPEDRLVWDVGHQTYGHKVLTGRRDRMKSLRQLNGLAGFPKRGESQFDTFGVGHASTSISAALGMAIANRNYDANRKVVSVIGDGALTAGMAFEALNHAGELKADLTVVLNDNSMSISENVGGLSRYLANLIAGKFYLSIRSSGKKVLKKMPSIHEFTRRWEEHLKGMVLPGTLFEELGFNYIGPIDGHDIKQMTRVLSNIKELNGPQFIHVVTKKGKGYEPAEKNPCAYHGVGQFDPKIGHIKAPNIRKPSYTDVFSDWICKAAKEQPRLVAITPAMREGSGLVEFSKQFPDRYFDVGIAEQHAVTFAAGLACEQYLPVVAIYSTFLQRAYDQVLHDVALQNLPVIFAVDRAGVVGPDGPTHAGNYDISYLRCVPNLVIMAPADAVELDLMLSKATTLGCPVAVRYPRDVAATPVTQGEIPQIKLGKGVVTRQGRKIAILSLGSMVHASMQAAQKLDATLVNMRFAKPIDEDLIRELTKTHEVVVTVEENTVMGGFGSAVGEFLHKSQIEVKHLSLGLPDELIEQGKRQELLSQIGLDADGIERSISHFLIKDCNFVPTQVIS
jgi:1-deoxy-D-xylulose-5-phosphate synthase